MDVKFITSTSKTLNTIPIDNGQVIALSDYDSCFYDMNDERHIISRVSGYSSTTGTSSAYIANIPGIVLRHGVMIALYISEENKANATLDMNGLGAKPIYYKGQPVEASKCPKGAVILMAYDTAQVSSGAWHCVYSYDSNTEYTNQSLGGGFGTCSTSESATAKIAQLTDYELQSGGSVSIRFTNNVPAASTLNINSKGAKSIYHRGAAIAGGIIKANDIATFIYDGIRYHLLCVDRDENTTYSQATSNQHGLVKIGYSQSGKNYPVQLNNTGQMFVTVPWTDNNTWQQNTVGVPGYVTAPTAANANKVWKTDGNGNPGWRDDANDNTDTNTTYELSAPPSKPDGNVTIDLTARGDGSGTDQVKIIGSGATQVTTDSSGAIIISSTDTVTQPVTQFQITAESEDDDVIVLAGTSGTNKVKYRAHHAAIGPSENGFTGNTQSTIINPENPENTFVIPKLEVDKYGHVIRVSEESISIKLPELVVHEPEEPNPEPEPEEPEEPDIDTSVVADMLASTTLFDGVSFNGTSNVNRYGVCSTPADTVSKSAVISSGVFNLIEGASVRIKFTNANTIHNPTLSVNGTNAKPILFRGEPITDMYYWSAGSVLDFVYSGAGWEAVISLTKEIMVGASANSTGHAGLVPTPHKGEQGLYLRGDGIWADPSSSTIQWRSH